MTWKTTQAAFHAKQRAESAAHIADWRARWNNAKPANCARCQDYGVVRWCGKSPDGRIGPCPRCHKAGATKFALQLARETFGDPRERAFIKALSGRPRE